MPIRTGLNLIIAQETKRIIGDVPDTEVQHNWPTLLRGVSRTAILSLTAVEPLLWQLFSYNPTSDERGLHPIDVYQYTSDGYIVSAVSTEATMQEMAAGTARSRLYELRQGNAAAPLPSHYLSLACFLQQAPAITTNMG